ncbi:hypothetical protein ACXR2U_22435 [Jatrophihabitans sp. YIM 134969]
MSQPDRPSWQSLPARRLPSERFERTTSRRRRVVTAVVVVLLVGAATTAYLVHRATSPFGVRVDLVIVGAGNFGPGAGGTAAGNGDDCAGTGTYEGLSQGQPLDVTAPDGHVLASGPAMVAEPGTDPKTGAEFCELVFDIADVPTGHDRYDVSFYGRFRHEFSADQLRDGVLVRVGDLTG